MYAPTTELVDSAGNRVAIAHVVRGRPLLGRTGSRLRHGLVKKVGIWKDDVAVILATSSGRRLSVAGDQRVFVRGRAGVGCWRRAKDIRVGVLLYGVADGILSVDRVTCVVVAEKRGEPWITVSTDTGSVFAEEILCRAS